MEDMRATEAELQEAAGERAQLLSQADEVKRQYLVAQDNVEEEQSVVTDRCSLKFIAAAFQDCLPDPVGTVASDPLCS